MAAEDPERMKKLDEFFEFYRYKGNGGGAKVEAPSIPPIKGRRTEEAPSMPPKKGRRTEEAPSMPPKKMKKKGKEKPFTPSNRIRVQIGNVTRVVSCYFPLPAGATNPVVVDQAEVDRERKRFKKREAQLTARAKYSEAYKRVDSPRWIPPRSPYGLLQEFHYFDPWRVLVICMLLNKTTGKQVSKILPNLFNLCPNAKAATEVDVDDLKEVIKSCGLVGRANMLKKFSTEYLGSRWTHVTELHGVGKYAADAYAIFCAGMPYSVFPQDHMLVAYWNFVHEKGKAEYLAQRREEWNMRTSTNASCTPTP